MQFEISFLPDFAIIVYNNLKKISFRAWEISQVNID